MNKLRSLIKICLIAAVSVISTGCNTPKNVTYFENIPETLVIETFQNKDFRVEPDNKLMIVVKSKDPALAELFNLGVYSNRLSNSVSSGNGTRMRDYSVPTADGMSSYTVNQEGDIDFPVLGKLHVAGMTRSELAAFIKGELMGRDLVKDPVVTVEFLNTGISILGEVNGPGRYDMNRDNISIVEAIALAGDLTITGLRENILVMREENGTISTYRVNLSDPVSLAKSPVYYLKPGDVIYVEPNEMKKRSRSVNGNNYTNASFWISIVSVITSMAVLGFK